jgi:O-antigen ligase
MVFNTKLSFRRRLICGLITAAILYVGVIRAFNWKSGWMPPLVAIAAIVALRFPRLLPVMILIGLPFASPAFQQLVQDDQYSYVTRLAAWEIVLFDIVKANPILGVGPANYRFYATLFPIMGWEVPFNSHNNYVDIIAQTGIVGLITFLWFIAEMVRLSWRLYKHVPEGFPKSYVAGAIGGLVATLFSGMLGDWFLPFVYNIGMRGFRGSMFAWLFLGGLLVVERVYTPSNNGSR